MKNPFLEPPKKPVDEVPSGILIATAALCMTCDEHCDEAEYFPVEKLLVWICVNGHRSVIENFNLGV
ncbi:hypothetical protein SEA_EVY_84 [Streptomyces phage Evy]|uniref:Uncharacterized protein n=3 Tax=Samistivirus TaxID=2560220 RepID=A0A221SAZ9_9CAUD|nr:hypothetical protein AXJ18_gp188 [Streptomyces phage Jay2Jay]YP_010103460.1 hypothetical protein KNU67_gp181 [Streptomyces phage Evy]ASN73161.1 hypothetical protein SEA_WARPY_87 [Streptomyces phage Warpy]UEM46872.1 hypothetical protein SEA_TARGARYEN_84 [Streptomyces phage Targaryen]AIW02586.1 hypothetical protein PBI_JAY2JAY_88 [Streptomyces phage Jay2Jay]QDH93951.1 hypothetical protein SEA_EVY_84 [Streptomyces phage Evy]